MEDNMKQFNLEEYLANPSRQVVTRDGRKVRIICTDRAGLSTEPIVALITLPNGDEVIKTFWGKGIVTAWSEDKNDLFFSSEKHEGWINVYRNKEHLWCGDIKRTETEAKEFEDSEFYITTIKIEWEE